MKSSLWHGLLNVDKPAGVTSREVVNRIGRLVGRTKIGHAGTLDPLATGVLVVCLGAATRLVDRIQEHAKGYRTGLTLGVRSDTDDSTGTVVPGSDPSAVTTAEIETILAEFQGEISQVPPKFSAVHVAGQRAYDLARSQQEFELSARTVHVDDVQLVARDGSKLVLDLRCGSGTYVRSIIRDLGDRLGCGAIMTSLQRTFIGPFLASQACSLESLTLETLENHLHPLRSVLSHDPQYHATDAECRALERGQGIEVSQFEAITPQTRVAVMDPTHELFAFATWDDTVRRLQPQRVFVRTPR